MQLRLSCVGPRSRPWLLSSLPVHQPRYMPPVQSSISRDQQPEASWEALTLAKRGLRLAIVEEDYRLAATLRDRVGDLTGALPPRKRLLASMLDNLQQPEVEVQAGALRVIGELADCDALPQLSLHLATPQLQSAVEAAMWRIFMHSDNLRVQMLMREACTMLNRPGDWDDAVKMFTAVVEEEPSFAEGYNKRATVLFLLQRYRESIQDCKLVLDLNPYHFAAASGMGMCYSRLGDYESAIQAFERALAIHPGMTELRQTCEQLRTMRGEE